MQENLSFGFTQSLGLSVCRVHKCLGAPGPSPDLACNGLSGQRVGRAIF